ncbi:MAG: tyrosine-type recombinase/integrase [Pseudobdellovibrionaceae bacterium]
MSIRKTILDNGEIKWDVRIYEDGRGSKRIFRRFDRKVDAEDFSNQTKEELRQKKLNPFGQMSFTDRTFEEEANYWLEDGKLRFSASHTKRLEGVFKELLPRFGKLTLEKFSPELIGQYQKDEKKKGSANATVNRKTDTIMAILNHSVKHRRIPFNPANGLRKLAKSQAEMAFWDQKEAVSFLNCMKELYPKGSQLRWVYVAYLVALNTAMRAGEIWGLRPMDVSDDGETILVRRQFNRVTNDFGPTKSKRSRLVPCPPTLRDELMSLIAEDQLSNMTTIFRNEQGNPICHDNFSDRQFQKDLKRWGGRPIRFHDMRHTATTLMIANGVDLKTVKEICGHADIATTMTYVHQIAGSVNKVAKNFSVEPEIVVEVVTLKVV